MNVFILKFWVPAFICRREVSKEKRAALRACRPLEEFLKGRIFRYREVGDIERKY